MESSQANDFWKRDKVCGPVEGVISALALGQMCQRFVELIHRVAVPFNHAADGSVQRGLAVAEEIGGVRRWTLRGQEKL